MFNKNRKQGPIAMPIKYEELDSARPSPRDKSEVELVFKGGRVEKYMFIPIRDLLLLH